MQRLFLQRDSRKSYCALLTLLGLAAATLMPGRAALAEQSLADRVNEAANRTNSPAILRPSAPSDYQPVFGIHYAGRDSRDCQVPLPPVGAVSPFPLALRLGAMLSPRTKFDGGIDATIRGLHLIPGATSRVDADAIVSANFGGISTLVPVTFDQIFQLNLPVGSRVYVGGGIGAYFGDKTRFGGKLIAGAEFNRIGLEGNVHFAGIGDTLFTVQARLGL